MKFQKGGALVWFPLGGQRCPCSPTPAASTFHFGFDFGDSLCKLLLEVECLQPLLIVVDPRRRKMSYKKPAV